MKREKRKKKRKEQVTLKGDKWVWYFFVSWCCCCFSNLSLKSSSCHEMEMKMDRGMCMKRKEWRDTGISSKYELQENNKRDQGEEGVKRGNIITSLTSISGWPASHGQKVERDLKTQKSVAGQQSTEPSWNKRDVDKRCWWLFHLFWATCESCWIERGIH